MGDPLEQLTRALDRLVEVPPAALGDGQAVVALHRSLARLEAVTTRPRMARSTTWSRSPTAGPPWSTTAGWRAGSTTAPGRGRAGPTVTRRRSGGPRSLTGRSGF